MADEFFLTHPTDEDMRRLGRDQTKLHMVFMLSRPGVRLFITKLEYTHFPPRTEKNKLFEFVLSKWPAGSEMMWGVVSIPIEYKPQALALIEECQLRLADGVPAVLGGGGPEFFPVEGPTAFSIENKSGHSVYGNDPKLVDALRSAENAACEAIVMADRIKHMAELMQEGYTQQQIDRMYAAWESGNDKYEEIPENKPMAKDGQHRHGEKK